jgi:hypothetical protein
VIRNSFLSFNLSTRTPTSSPIALRQAYLLMRVSDGY